MMIKISEIKVTPIKPNKTLIAFCSFLVDECLYVGDIALHYRPQEERDPYWLVYPSKVLFNGKRINTVHPVNQETGLFIIRAVVKEYEEQTKRIREDESHKGGLSDEQG